MKLVDCGRKDIRLVVFDTPMTFEENVLYDGLRTGITGVVQWVFVLLFERDYGRMFMFSGHIYVPEKDLTVCVRNSRLVYGKVSETRMHFVQEWIIMGEDMWVEADVEFDSSGNFRKVLSVGAYLVRSKGESVAHRLQMFIDKMKKE